MLCTNQCSQYSHACLRRRRRWRLRFIAIQRVCVVYEPKTRLDPSLLALMNAPKTRQSYTDQCNGQTKMHLHCRRRAGACLKARWFI